MEEVKGLNVFSEGLDLVGDDITDITLSDEQLFENMIRNTKASGYCSYNATTQEDKAKLYMACFSDSKKLSKYVDKEIVIHNIFVHTVNVKNLNGDLIPQPRVVLIDKDFNGYQCVSLGVYSELKNIISIFGTPEQWVNGLKFKVIETKVTRGTLLSIKLV